VLERLFDQRGHPQLCLAQLVARERTREGSVDPENIRCPHGVAV
jgi:hypothetical protein